MKTLIEKILKKNFSTYFVSIKNFSNLHSIKKKHSHYSIIIVSNVFDTLPILKRHQLIYNLLRTKNIYIYSIDLYTYSISEWQLKKTHSNPRYFCFKKNT